MAAFELSMPSVIDIEALDISSRTPLPTSNQPPKPISDDALDLLTKEHEPVLQQFFRLVIGEPTGGFFSTATDFALQLWDQMEAHCARHEYACRSAPASWVDLVYLPVRRDHDALARGPVGP